MTHYQKLHSAMWSLTFSPEFHKIKVPTAKPQFNHSTRAVALEVVCQRTLREFKFKVRTFSHRGPTAPAEQLTSTNSHFHKQTELTANRFISPSETKIIPVSPPFVIATENPSPQ